jgi:hypothetical protein
MRELEVAAGCSIPRRRLREGTTWNVWRGLLVRVMGVLQVERDAWLRVALHEGHGAAIYEYWHTR